MSLRRQNRFSLMELIVVMMLIATVLAATSPALARFFRGRSVVEECRRLLAVTRYARTVAVCGGIPIEVTFDTETGSYRVATAEGYPSDGGSASDFTVGDRIALEVPDGDTATGAAPKAVFNPDGTLGENSPELIIVRSVRDEADRLMLRMEETRRGYTVEEAEGGPL